MIRVKHDGCWASNWAFCRRKMFYKMFYNIGSCIQHLGTRGLDKQENEEKKETALLVYWMINGPWKHSKITRGAAK